MNQFDIFITCISWGTGSKNRPVLVLLLNGGNIFVFPITTQYDKKSEAIRAKYFKINDWIQSGLDRQSYIDTGTLIKLPSSVINTKKQLGKLTTKDKQRLLDFLTK